MNPAAPPAQKSGHYCWRSPALFFIAMTIN
jgi:hypothetical protein